MDKENHGAVLPPPGRYENEGSCLKKSYYLVEERYSSVHVGSLLLIVAGSLHHVLRVTEQGQVHQLVIQAVLLSSHLEMHHIKYKMQCIWYLDLSKTKTLLCFKLLLTSTSIALVGQQS